MPADKGVRLNDRQSIANSGEQPIETNEYQTVDGTEGKFLWSSPPQDVYLLPQRPDLCLERCARPEQIDDCPTNKSAKIPHPTIGLPDSRSTASRMRFTTGTASSTGRKAGCERVIQKDVTLGVRGAREIEANEELSATDELLGRWAKQRPEPRSTFCAVTIDLA